MKVNINTVQVNEGRRRLNRERVAEIAESIKTVGLLNPITITRDNVLVAGAHRLEACKLLGWDEIDATTIEATGLIAELAEIDENLMRHDLTELERSLQVARRKRIYEELYPHTKHGGDRRSDQVDKVVNLKPQAEEPSAPRFTSATARVTGENERTVYRQARRGEELAKDPVMLERLHALPQVADSGAQLDEFIAMPQEQRVAVIEVIERGEAHTLHEAKRELKIKARESRKEERREALGNRVDDLRSITQKYRVIYADPPWRYREEQHSSEGVDQIGVLEGHYPTMSIDELCQLPVASICESDAVLFLWVTSPLLEECFEVIRAWGFKYKTSMVWSKLRHNVGNYVSVRHEMLLICTRGSCTPDNRKLHNSVQVIERTAHSEKPEQFRSIIDDIYTYGRRIELFRRGAAPDGWDVWGNEA